MTDGRPVIYGAGAIGTGLADVHAVTLRILFALLLLSACGDDSSPAGDAPPGDGRIGLDGTIPDAPPVIRTRGARRGSMRPNIARMWPKSPCPTPLRDP